MERPEAMLELGKLIGTDLCVLAKEMNIPIRHTSGHINKGWAGHSLERYLGLPLNSSQSPNFGSWELKQGSLKHLQDGTLVVKETLKITKIDPVEVAQKPFADSHLFRKLCKAIVVARIWESKEECHSILHSVTSFDLDHPQILEQVRRDYENVRQVFLHGGGIDDLTGRMGVLVQPRTNGPGHQTVNKPRAFYARKEFVAHILNITPLKTDEWVDGGDN